MTSLERFAIGLLATVALVIATFFYGSHLGAQGVQAAWDKDRADMQDARAKAIAVLVNKYDAERLTNERKAREASAHHDKALSALDRAYAADLAAVRRAGGLRIPATACARLAASGQAAGAGGPDESAAATVELPERTQAGLFALTLRADQLAERLRALQGWIRSNGFYGTADENSGNP